MRDDVGVYGVCGIDGADSIGCSKISDISVCDGSVDGGGGVIKHLLTEWQSWYFAYDSKLNRFCSNVAVKQIASSSTN